MNTCKIVMYHYVRPIKNSKFPNIHGLELDNFKIQIEYFKNHYQFITFEQILSSIYDGIKIPDNAILLTFDDGLKEHYTHVFPILKKYQIQGTFFPIGESIQQHNIMDAHKIHFIMDKCQDIHKLIDVIFKSITDNKQKYSLSEPQIYFKKLAVPNNRYDTNEVAFIKKSLQMGLPKELRSEITDYLFKQHVSNDEHEFSNELYMSHDNIREMQNEGMFFGSHSYSHEWLNHLDPKSLDSEINKSVEFFKTISMNPDMIINFPYGGYDENVVKSIKKYGHKGAVTIIPKDAELIKKNAFTLGRYDTNDFPPTKTIGVCNN